MGLRNSWYEQLPMWIISMALLPLSGCPMVAVEQVIGDSTNLVVPDDSQLSADEMPADGRLTFDPLEDDASGDLLDGPRTQDPSRVDDPARELPDDDTQPANNDPTGDLNDCRTPDDVCCLRNIEFVRRMERSGLRISDNALRGNLIRSTAEAFPQCFAGFIFAAN